MSVHRARRLDRCDVMRRDGILVTSPARTRLDLAALPSPDGLKRAVRQAQADQHVNVRQLVDARPILPDLLWREQRLIVEDDSKRYHAGPLALAGDAERRAILEAHGYRVLRVTWQQAVGRPRQTLARLRAALRPG